MVSSLEEDVNFISMVNDLSPNYPTGWAQVSATPFRYYKESAHYLGGIRVPLIVHYPSGIDEEHNGEIRGQFSFVTDIAKTVFDLLGINQMELEGYSIKNTFNDSNGDTGRNTQFFELYGNRALYHENYFLSSIHEKGDDFNNDTWALYDLSEDYSQLKDIASENESQLKKMIKLLDKELEKYSAYPTTFNRRHTITAYIDRKDVSGEGVLIAFGNRFGGYILYVMDNKLHYEYNFDRKSLSLTSTDIIPTGNIKLSLSYEKEDNNSGTATLLINDENVGSLYIPKVDPFVASSTDEMSVERDLQDTVSSKYREMGYFEYTGELERIIIDSKDDFNRFNR